jgi:tRNA(Ile)-lysidine synthase
MIPEGGRVLVALSGGPDSVALTLLLMELQERAPFRVAAVAHVNHGLRDQADADEAFCREFAERLGLPCRVERFDVREIARVRRRSLEDTGRAVRYEFFRRVLRESGLDVVATGHTRNDQAETFLLRLFRGAGAAGLAGIHPVAGRVVRPLLDTRREDLVEYLAPRGQSFCQDATNLDLSIPRNRVRHDIIPHIERTLAPGLIDILAREADLARLDEAHLLREAIDSSGLIVLRNSSGGTVRLGPGQITMSTEDGPILPLPPSDVALVDVDAAGLAALPQAVGSRVTRLVLSILAPGRFVGFDHVQAVLALAAAAGGRVSLPGQQATRRGASIELSRQPFEAFANAFSYSLSIPGEVLLAPQGWAISAEPAGSDLELPLDRARSVEIQDLTPMVVAVRADTVVQPLIVRSRRPGDRFRPPGMGGRGKKLQDFLVDRKVPREARDLLPIVADGEDRIVWIVGHAVGEDFRVTDPSQGVILLKARRLGGPG